MRLVIASLLMVGVAPSAADTLVLRGGRVHTISGATLPQADVVIADGIIRAVGERATVPRRARSIDLSAKTVTPGFLDCASHLGLFYERDETVEPVTAQLSVIDCFAPRRQELLATLNSGVTTVLLSPGDQNPVGGMAAIVKLGATASACRVINREAGLKISLSDNALLPLRAPTSRPELEETLRRAFSEPHDGANTAIDAARAGQNPVFASCQESDQIEPALGLATDFGLRMRVVGATEAHIVAARLSAAKVPLILPPSQVLGGAVQLRGIAELAGAGVELGFGSWSPIGTADDLRATAALCVKHGLSRSEALEALTLRAASILGIADRVGSIEPGKEADLVVFDGDPLDLTSRVERVLVDGQQVLINGNVVRQGELP